MRGKRCWDTCMVGTYLRRMPQRPQPLNWISIKTEGEECPSKAAHGDDGLEVRSALGNCTNNNIDDDGSINFNSPISLLLLLLVSRYTDNLIILSHFTTWWDVINLHLYGSLSDISLSPSSLFIHSTTLYSIKPIRFRSKQRPNHGRKGKCMDGYGTWLIMN